jgi:hypothetical protein
MMRIINGPPASIDGSNSSLFILTGQGANFTLADNFGSLLFMAGVRPQVALNLTDGNETILDRLAQGATVSIFGGLLGHNSIWGFAGDAAATVRFVSGDVPGEPEGDISRVGSDGWGGTMINFSGGGWLDIAGDRHFGIGTHGGDVGPHGVIFRNN